MKNLVLGIIALCSYHSYSQNLVKNYSFKRNTQDWKLNIDKHLSLGDNLDASLHATDRSGHNDLKAAKIRVASAHPEKKSLRISLDQKIEGFKKNKHYKLSFWAKSSMLLDDHISFMISSNTDKKHAAYTSGKLHYTGDNQWHHIVKIFETKNTGKNKVDNDNVYLQFGFAHRKGTFYIDDVRIEQL